MLGLPLILVFLKYIPVHDTNSSGLLRDLRCQEVLSVSLQPQTQERNSSTVLYDGKHEPHAESGAGVSPAFCTGK